jgi:hypothetical protein
MDPDLLCPLWQYQPAAAVTADDPDGTLAEILFARACRILEETPEGHAYHGGILCDATIRAALFAETLPRCTLREVYQKGLQPETAPIDQLCSVENTDRFVKEIASAVLVQPGRPKSAAARFFAKGTVNTLSSVRYVATQFQKIVSSGEPSERDLVETYVSMAVLGSFPGCRVTAPLPIRVWLYRDPKAAVTGISERVKSKLLWLMLVEFVGAVVERWPTLDRILAMSTEREVGSGVPFRSVNNDTKLRRDVYALIRYHFLGGAEAGGSAPRTGRYTSAADANARCAPVVSAYDAALVQHSIKRKLSGNTIRALGPRFPLMYRAIVEESRRPRQIEPRLMERYGIPDTDEGRTLYVHALEQRAAGLTIVPTLPIVEQVQARAAKAAGIAPIVQICVRCNTLRDTPAGEKSNKATTGTVLTLQTGSRECANCGCGDTIVDVDARGYWFVWLARNIDRDPNVATICGVCGCFSRAHALIGAIPVCEPCTAAERRRPRATASCAVCATKIYKKAPSRPVLCIDPRSKSGTPETKLVCRSCQDLEASDTAWDTKSLKQLQCRPPRP